MNKTRQKIIELIEPYMDKSLKYGCLFLYENEWDKGILTFCSIYNDTGGTATLSYLIPSKERTDELNSFTNYDILNFLKIIGHYSITAVLKYIDNYYQKSSYGIKYEIDNKEFSFYFGADNLRYGSDFDIFIPNKPLHLYTEQEEIQLLNLLNKLK